MRTQDSRARLLRIVCYVLLVVPGAITAWQITTFESPLLFRPLWWVMAGFLTVGGLVSLGGQVVRRWPGEFVGLPLAGSALVGFSLLQLNLYGWVLEMVPSTALLWALAVLLALRWRDVWTLYRQAREGGPQ